MPTLIAKRVPKSFIADYQLFIIFQHWNFVQYLNVFPEMGWLINSLESGILSPLAGPETWKLKPET